MLSNLSAKRLLEKSNWWGYSCIHAEVYPEDSANISRKSSSHRILQKIDWRKVRSQVGKIQ